MLDYYKTISKKNEGELFKDRGSKFYGYAFPIQDESQVNIHLEELRSQHHKAGHFCYAWRLNDRYRVNDDGEPSNSAGQPIYGQLLSFNVNKVLVVVVRYFGGTKLGVGGLVSAYKSAAKTSLETAHFIEKTINQQVLISFDYPQMDKVLKIITAYDAQILKRKMELNCEFTLEIRLSSLDEFTAKLTARNMVDLTLIAQK